MSLITGYAAGTGKFSTTGLETGDVQPSPISPAAAADARLGEQADAGPAGRTGAPANRIGTAVNWAPAARAADRRLVDPAAPAARAEEEVGAPLFAHSSVF